MEKKEQPPTADEDRLLSSSDRHQPPLHLSLSRPPYHHRHCTDLQLNCPSQVTEPEPEPEPSSNHEKEGGGMMVEKEHMFDKVVTPSDVGKLNRLVIPKQHAERCFPLDSSTNEKGLLLNFEDRDGKLWRFRYSYWNSSQSYVMTKGWSRFVKDKKLDAGDIVSFQRGVGVTAKDRLFIDWRRRVDTADPRLSSNLSFSFPHHNFIPPLRSHPRRSFNFMSQTLSTANMNTGGSRSIICFGPDGFGTQLQAPVSQTPLVRGKASGKRLRLFGVNMDCPLDENEDNHNHDRLHKSTNTSSTVAGCSTMNPISMGPYYNYATYNHGRYSPPLVSPSSSSPPFSTIPYLQLRPYGGETGSSSALDFNIKTKSSAASNISLDLDI